MSGSLKLVCDSSDKECKDAWLYKNEETGNLFHPPAKAIKLSNGENYHKTRVKYSPFNYKKICIVWDIPPKDRFGDSLQPQIRP